MASQISTFAKMCNNSLELCKCVPGELPGELVCVGGGSALSGLGVAWSFRNPGTSDPVIELVRQLKGGAIIKANQPFEFIQI